MSQLPPAQLEPQDRTDAIDLLIHYDADVHGPALAYYRALKGLLNRLHAEAGGAGVRLGLATAELGTGRKPTGRISIPVTPLNPADPLTAMNKLARALLDGRSTPGGVVRVTPRQAP